MPFDRQLVADDEEILAESGLHWSPLVAPVLLTAAAIAAAVAVWVEFPDAPMAVAWVLAAMVALPLLWLVGRVLSWRSVRLVVTTGRLLYRKGVLGRDVAQLRLQRVAEVHCTQTLRGRLVGSGRLVLEIAGGDAMVIDHVPRPRSLQRVIAGQLDESWYPGFGPAPGGPPGWSVPSDPGRLGPTDTPPHGTSVATTWSVDTVVGTGAGAPAVSGTNATSVPDQLIRLDELRRRGIITAEEFHVKKRELLDRL